MSMCMSMCTIFYILYSIFDIYKIIIYISKHNYLLFIYVYIDYNNKVSVKNIEMQTLS